MQSVSNRRMAAIVLAFCFIFAMLVRGTGESFTVYLLPVSASFGWDRAAVLSINSLTWLSIGLSGPFVGRLFDRAGPRSVYISGLLLVGAGFYVGTYAHELWQLQLCLGLAVGLGLACLGNVPASLLLSRWFGQRLPRAMVMIYAAGGLGILVLVPLSQILIDHFDWRDAYRITAAGILSLIVAVALLPWRKLSAGTTATHPSAQANIGAPDDGWTLVRAMRTSAFWGLFSAYFFTGVGMMAISVQVVAYLVDAGFPALEAATAWGFSGVILFASLVIVAWLDTLIGRVRTMLLMYCLTTVGLALLWLLHRYPNWWLLSGFLICFGGSIGSRGPLIAATAMHIFRGRHVGAIFGTISVGTGLGPALGSWIGGLIHDTTQGYDWLIAFAFVSVWIGMSPFLTVRALREQHAIAT